LSRYFRAILQLHKSPVDCARELSKPSNDLSSFLICNEKNFEVLGFSFVVGNVINRLDLGFLAEVNVPWASTEKGKYFTQFFFVETTLTSGVLSF